MCGDDNLIRDIWELLNHCAVNDTDPANYYHAFPRDEPIPESYTGATPRQVDAIIDFIAGRKRVKRIVTIDITASTLNYPKHIVKAVFDELHITEGKAA